MANKPSLYPVFMKNEVFPADTCVTVIGPERITVDQDLDINVKLDSTPINVEVVAPVINVKLDSTPINVEVD